MTTSSNSDFRPRTLRWYRAARQTLRTGLCGLWLAMMPGLSVAQDTAVPVETLRLTPDATVAADTFFGSVRARDIFGLSYQARGCIVEVAEEAKLERVAQAGEVLVRLDDARARLALATAEARLSDLAAAVEERQLALDSAIADGNRRQEDLDFVGEEFQRNSTMLGRGLINETTMDAVERRFMDAKFAAARAQEAVDNAAAARKRADIALKIGELDRQTAELNLEDMSLEAPFDGVLVGFEANVGDCVQEGALAGQIYEPDLKSVDVYLQISRLTDSHAAGLTVGSDVKVTRVNGTQCAGAITRMDTRADLENQHVQVTIDVEESCAPDLFLNESVEIEPVKGAANSTFSIPSTAIVGENTVFLVDEDNQSLVATRAEVVYRGDRSSVVIIQDGDGRLLVTGGQDEMVDGQRVTVRNPG